MTTNRSITEEAMAQLSEISEIVERYTTNQEHPKTPRLIKLETLNRIHAIATGRKEGRHMSLIDFLRESLAIESIFRDPTADEIRASERFLSLTQVSVITLGDLQAVYAPGFPLRAKPGMDVRVGNYIAPRGGLGIISRLQTLCEQVNRLDANNSWYIHCQFQILHPYMDGNGRTGRMLWAWHMHKLGYDPFALPFLHRFYYQTLENSR